MVNLTRIYTRGGDAGETSLGDGRRVSKASARIAAYGTVDELNAHIGVLRTLELPDGWDAWLARIQNELFDLGADLCVPEEERPDRSSERERTRLRVDKSQVAWLEARCDEVNEQLPPLTSFILPGGTPAAAQLHVCRTVCRRAEREIVALGRARAGQRRRRRPTPTASPTCCSSSRGRRTRRAPSRSGSRAPRGPTRPGG